MLHIILKIWAGIIVLAAVSRMLTIAYFMVTLRWRERIGVLGALRLFIAHVGHWRAAVGDFIVEHGSEALAAVGRVLHTVLVSHLLRYIVVGLWYFAPSFAIQRGVFGFKVGLRLPLGAVYFQFRFADNSRMIRTGLVFWALPTAWAFWAAPEGALQYRYHRGLVFSERSLLTDYTQNT